MPERFFPLSTAPAPYEIVWCRFPYVEDPGIPGPVPHPGLVRVAFADNDGNPWVQVVYGTSSSPFKPGLEYFTVSKMSEMDQCGLYRATRFCFDRCMELPWGPDYFTPLPRTGTIVLGRLSDYAIKLLQVQMSYRQNQDT